ncbi:MAG TPA: MBL fold metallo-hydrolase [Vicinamibacterales bacterium]|jgi:glyoxylase-like metal-dependent hydrolase (beta-lactamase superfamily II)|nr:MBL fold metallo-hydrolase [Vicinamibacterales bacterium]
MKRLAVYALTTSVLIAVLYQRQAATQINTVKELAPGVYFHEGDLRGKGHCNNGWVIFEDYVLVLDANYPSGAQEIIPKIKAQTNKPIRFAFDTHHHGDHAYANQVWTENGAVPVAHENVVSEMRKYETGFFGGTPGRWEGEAKEREDLRSTRLKPPSLLYRDLMIFDDGKHRVELRHFGVAHTHGDGFAWLPKERILFTGDAAVNGPYNFMGDGDSAAWIETLGRAQKLGATIVAPGHGPSGDAGVLEAQRQFFVALRAEVEKRKGLAPDRVQAEVSAMREALLKRHATYIDTDPKPITNFEAQVAKVYRELTGKEFLKQAALDAARRAHEGHHGLGVW